MLKMRAASLLAPVIHAPVTNARFRPLLDGRHVPRGARTRIGEDAWIGRYTIIGRGATIGPRCIVEEYVHVQAEAKIGERVLLTSRSYVGLGAVIGNDCVIRGHIGDNCRVGNDCRIAGELIHRQLDPTVPWDAPDAEEPSPVVEDGAFVGWRAIVIGGVNIGKGAYVCAGALITKDVPAGYIARNRNEIIHPSAWSGALGKSPFFRADEPERFLER